MCWLLNIYARGYCLVFASLTIAGRKGLLAGVPLTNLMVLVLADTPTSRTTASIRSKTAAAADTVSGMAESLKVQV